MTHLINECHRWKYVFTGHFHHEIIHTHAMDDTAGIFPETELVINQSKSTKHLMHFFQYNRPFWVKIGLRRMTLLCLFEEFHEFICCDISPGSDSDHCGN